MPLPYVGSPIDELEETYGKSGIPSDDELLTTGLPSYVEYALAGPSSGRTGPADYFLVSVPIL